MITQKPEYASFTIPDSSPVLANRTYALSEAAPNGFSIGTPLAATDANPEDILTYTILSGNEDGVFALSSSGQFSVVNNIALDFETTPQYVLITQVSDGTGNFDTATITILVGDVFEAIAPVVTNEVRYVVETDPNGTVVGAPIIATDSNPGETLSFSIQSGNTDNIFAIDSVSGQITVADNTLMDFGVTPQYTLIIAVFDGILTGTGTVTVNITDVYIPVAPVIDSTFTRAIAETAVNGALVGTPLTGTDGNIEDTLTYAITAGNNDGIFAIDNTGQITVLSSIFLNFETTPQYVLGVFFSDNTGRADSTTVTINIVNAAPALNNLIVSVAESAGDGTVLGTMVGSDPKGASLTYTILSGNDSGIFAIDSVSGIVTVANSLNLNYETSAQHILSIRVSDGGLTASATLTVNVSNIGPSITPSAGFIVAESAVVGYEVGTVVASDPKGGAITYTITAGNTGTAFAISNAGVITVNNVTNYETLSSYTLTIQVSDGLLTNASNYAIAVSNEPPVVSNQTFSVSELSGNGTTVGTVTASDVHGATLSYSITGGNTDNIFAINSSSGAVTVANNTLLDYGRATQYILTVQVSDGFASVNATVTINIVDVSITQTSGTFSMDTLESSGVLIGTVIATGGPNLTYSITGSVPSGNYFTINSSGQIYTSSTPYDGKTNGATIILSVQVSDGANVLVANHTVNVIVPFHTLEYTLVNPSASGSGSGDQFGISAAMDGDYAIVGSHLEDLGGTSSGSAYIFNVTTGALVHTLVDPNAYSTPTNDRFGVSVDLKGNYAIVGATHEQDAGGLQSGKAYIFNVTTGALLHTLDNPNAYNTSAYDEFGNSVSIDGNYAVVSARYEDSSTGAATGVVYVFNVTTGAYLRRFSNPVSGVTNQRFGLDVDLSGSTVIIGTNRNDVSLYNVTNGAFLRKITNPNVNTASNLDQFGISVAINGNYAVVGAPSEDVGATDAGSVYIFNVSNGALIRTINNPAPGPNTTDYFGYSVSISGNYVIVGAFQDDTGATNAGSAYVFNITTGALLSSLSETTESNSWFGRSVDISTNKMIVASMGGTSGGKLYVYST